MAVVNLHGGVQSSVWLTLLFRAFGLCLGLSIYFCVCVCVLYTQGCNVTVENVMQRQE